MKQKKKEILQPLEALEMIVMQAWMASIRDKKPGEMVLRQSKTVRSALKRLKSKDAQTHRTCFNDPREELASKKRKSRLTKAVTKQREDDKAKKKKVKSK